MRDVKALLAAVRAAIRAVAGPRVEAPASEPRDAIHVVEADDNLWDIAARHLATQVGLPVGALDDERVADYWRRVIQANRTTLRTGDPDLLLPGEIIVLPPVS